MAVETFGLIVAVEAALDDLQSAADRGDAEGILAAGATIDRLFASINGRPDSALRDLALRAQAAVRNALAVLGAAETPETAMPRAGTARMAFAAYRGNVMGGN